MIFEVIVVFVVWLGLAHLFAWLVSLSAKGDEARARVRRRWKLGCVPFAFLFAFSALLRLLR